MDSKFERERRQRMPLVIIFAVCVLILILLSILLFKNMSASVGGSQYVEIIDLEGLSLSEAKAALDAQGIAYTISPAKDSKIANRVITYEGGEKTDNGKITLKSDTVVKLYANEVGKDKVVYLTFDDGPTRDNTFDILNTLDKYGIKASFFVEGQDVALWPDRMVATFERGHIIACHSYSHVYDDLYSSTNAFLREIEQYEAALKSAIGENNFENVKKIIRFPGGTNNSYLSRSESIAYINAVRAKGYKVYDWTALTGDAEGKKTASEFISHLTSGLDKAKSNGEPLILLMHDRLSTNEALSQIIDHLVSKGYYFDTVDNCSEYTFVE